MNSKQRRQKKKVDNSNNTKIKKNLEVIVLLSICRKIKKGIEDLKEPQHTKENIIETLTRYVEDIEQLSRSVNNNLLKEVMDKLEQHFNNMEKEKTK